MRNLLQHTYERATFRVENLRSIAHLCLYRQRFNKDLLKSSYMNFPSLFLPENARISENFAQHKRISVSGDWFRDDFFSRSTNFVFIFFYD